MDLQDLEIITLNGDITELKVDAIINPSNSLGIMGGGVAGALRQKGGKVIEDEAKKAAPLEIGQAVLTTSGNLVASYIIHAPTMNKPSERTSAANVKQALVAALNISEEKKLTSIAIPGMGTGVGKVSPEESAEAVIGVLRRFEAQHLKKVYLIDVNDKMINAFDDTLKKEMPD